MASPGEYRRDLQTINKMHNKMRNTLETKDCGSFELICYSIEVSSLSFDTELLPSLEQYDNLVNALRIRFRRDLKDLLPSVDEQDRIELVDCFEDVEDIAKMRKLELLPPLDLDAATLGQRTAQGFADSALNHVETLVNERLSEKSGEISGGGGGESRGKKPSGDGKDVFELTDSNFEHLVLNSNDIWLVEFFAPCCGHCKNLAPHWAQAAGELKGKVKLGALDATVHTVMANRYGVRGYPTIKMFPAGKKDGDTVEFDGGRTADDIVAWALDKLAENVPAPDVIELTEESVLKKACEEHQLCIVAILPHILDCQSECRNRYLTILRTLGEKHKKRIWGWVWAEAGSQLEVENSLNIGGFGYPAMAAVNARKMKFSILKGSFSEKGINEFLLEVAVGRSSTEPVKSGTLPKIEEIPAWNGKDGELPVEEDIDLSDVDLDDTKKDEL